MRSRLEYDLAWGALKNWTERTHFKPVCRHTGQRRPRFVFTEWIRPGEPWIMWGAATRVDPIVVAPPSVVLLWALACEMDDRGATFTGDRVHRACSGRGWTFSHGSTSKILGGVDPVVTSYVPNIRIDVSRSRDLPGLHPDVHQPRSHWHHAARRDPCPCDGPTRPDTVSLAWLVAHLAAQRSPIVNDWPDQWRVNRDQADATGDDSWQAQWWRAFEIWVTAGIAPDADDLAGLLGALTPERTVTAAPFVGGRYGGVVSRRPERVFNIDTHFQPLPRQPATAEFSRLEFRVDGYNPQREELAVPIGICGGGGPLMSLGVLDGERAIVTGTVRGRGDVTVSIWANGAQVASHTRYMSGTTMESIVLDAVIDPGLQELEVRAEAWEHEAIVQGGTDEDVAQAVMGQIAHLAQADHQRSVYQSFVSTAPREDLDRMMALADVARIERETITVSEVRAQRFMDDDG